MNECDLVVKEGLISLNIPSLAAFLLGHPFRFLVLAFFHTYMVFIPWRGAAARRPVTPTIGEGRGRQ